MNKAEQEQFRSQVYKLLERCDEALPDHETRLLILESMHAQSDASREEFPGIAVIEEVYKEPQWTRRQWDFVQQLLARVLHAESKLESHITATKKKKDTYIIK